MDTEMLVAALAFVVTMCLTPGPNNLLCAAHGSQHGVRETIPLTLGMVVGWSSLGLLVGAATVFIEENEGAFRTLTLVGAIYIAYLAYKIATAVPTDLNDSETERLGFRTGLALQLVNGKAWIHFLVLMTTFGATFGPGYASKALLVFLNAAIGYPAVITWATFGAMLRRLFSTEESARSLNRLMGLSLFAVAVWLVLPH